ncbi:MAG: ferredoxin [Burkholderiales bacterium RIFCSPHIGHO2_12_FULL_69_20]|nr:MAG: ferredoxin [Burkholderiales bacterium RIFCSPHIGHO2_12_FULL_69_20]
MSSSGKKVLRVIADRSRCCGYGLCAQMCPEIYKLDEDGLVVLATDTVPEGLEEEAREGAAACPAEALVIEEVND